MRREWLGFPTQRRAPKGRALGRPSVPAQVVLSRGPTRVGDPQAPPPPPQSGPLARLTVLEETLLVKHGDGIDAEKGRLQQRVQRKGHGHPPGGPTDSSPPAARDVARPRPALPTAASEAQNAL